MLYFVFTAVFHPAGQSGTQIATELAEHGREVFLAVGRPPSTRIMG